MRIPTVMQDPQVSSLQIDNVQDGETIYQRALLIKGRSTSHEEFGDTLLVTVKDALGRASPPATWPVSKGHFKAMILLSPGQNTVVLERHNNGQARESTTLSINYVPLLQLPPLHLAIMVAKDSPLLMDCPAYKTGGLTTAHSDLDSAIAKMRIAAYMWQALTAEDMRSKGLGRRSFRLEEEYAIDTTRRTTTRYRLDRGKTMASVPKVHVIRSDKTVAKLLDPDVAQQHERGRNRDALHQYFEHALKAHGGVFASSMRSIVAGMILDSAFCLEQNLLLGHAALGCHKANGLSLGVFGSHLMYSWPRFLEEVPGCLTDTTPPDDLVCNDNGECGTCWEAASIGQGAFLHEVGHAFGASHTSGIMARGYAQDWPKNFLAETAYCLAKKSDGATVIDGTTPNNAVWSLEDALSFRGLPQFQIPGDRMMNTSEQNSIPSIKPSFGELEEADKIVIDCKAGIAQIRVVNGMIDDTTHYDLSLDEKPRSPVTFSLDLYDRSFPLSFEVIGLNGSVHKVTNAWRLLRRRDFVRIPDSEIILHKRSAIGNMHEANNDDSDTEMDENDGDADDECSRGEHEWAVLLNEKGPSGQLSRAKTVDLRVGCILDGAVVYYEDGHSTPCGLRYERDGSKHEFGGHASKKLHIPKDVNIVKVEVNRSGWGSKILGGIRMTLSNGHAVGELNSRYNEDESNITVLEPGKGEKIVGLFGSSSCYTNEFGIILAPKDVELPPQTYNLAELQNIQERP